MSGFINIYINIVCDKLATYSRNKLNKKFYLRKIEHIFLNCDETSPSFRFLQNFKSFILQYVNTYPYMQRLSKGFLDRGLLFTLLSDTFFMRCFLSFSFFLLFNLCYKPSEQCIQVGSRLDLLLLCFSLFIRCWKEVKRLSDQVK